MASLGCDSTVLSDLFLPCCFYHGTMRTQDRCKTAQHLPAQPPLQTSTIWRATAGYPRRGGALRGDLDSPKMSHVVEETLQTTTQEAPWWTLSCIAARVQRRGVPAERCSNDDVCEDSRFRRTAVQVCSARLLLRLHCYQEAARTPLRQRSRRSRGSEIMLQDGIGNWVATNAAQ